MTLLKKENLPNGTLAHALWELSEQAFDFQSPWTIEQFQGDIENDRSFYILEYLNVQLVGFVCCHMILDEAEIVNVAVAPAYKHQGIGRRLFQELFEQLTQKGIKEVWLEVREGNLPARKLYQQVGFREIGRRKKYYQAPQEDGLMMFIELNQEVTK